MTQIATPTFRTNPEGLAPCEPSQVIELADGDLFELRLSAVAKKIGDDTIRMLAYNGSVPGPTIRVHQGSELRVRVFNDGDHEATVHPSCSTPRCRSSTAKLRVTQQPHGSARCTPTSSATHPAPAPSAA